MSDHESQDVRDLLGEAVADVQPRHGVDDIQARTTSRRRRRWVWGSAGAVVATAATIAAVALVTNLPGIRSAVPGPASQAQTSSLAPVYFLGDTGVGPRLFREDRPGPSGEGATVHALQLSVAGSALDPDYRSMWPSNARVTGLTAETGTLVIHLEGTGLRTRPAGVSAAAARMSVQQLVYTARRRPDSPSRVRFEVDGHPVGTLLGVPVGSVSSLPADDTLAPVSISSPASPGEDRVHVNSPVTVRGQASAVEANVQWELMQGDTVVKRGFTTAHECCTLSPYTFRFRAAPGDYTLVVHDEDVSGGEGASRSQDTKLIHVG